MSDGGAMSLRVVDAEPVTRTGSVVDARGVWQWTLTPDGTGGGTLVVTGPTDGLGTVAEDVLRWVGGRP